MEKFYTPNGSWFIIKTPQNQAWVIWVRVGKFVTLTTTWTFLYQTRMCWRTVCIRAVALLKGHAILLRENMTITRTQLINEHVAPWAPSKMSLGLPCYCCAVPRDSHLIHPEKSRCTQKPGAGSYRLDLACEYPVLALLWGHAAFNFTMNIVQEAKITFIVLVIYCILWFIKALVASQNWEQKY